MFTREAVVLVPGLFGFGAFGAPPRRISYFERSVQLLSSALAIAPGRFVVHAPSPTAPLAVRVASLHRCITGLLETGLADGPVERVHLIGHSTGGVDLRLLGNRRFLWPGGPTGAARHDFLDRVGAMIAISAPHHGTPIANRLRGPAELLPSLTTLLSILAKCPAPVTSGHLLAALIGYVHRGRATAMPARLLDQRTETMGDIFDFVTAIRRERVVIDELSPFAMARLNRSIAGGELRAVTDYVTVSPPPRLPRRPEGGLESLARLLYAIAYPLAHPADADAEPFPAGEFLGASARALALRAPGACDGVVPAASQAFEGRAEAVVEGDHLDVVGHFASDEWPGLAVFKSDAGFVDERFERLWKHIARSVARCRTTRSVPVAGVPPRLVTSADTEHAEAPDAVDEFDYVVIGSGPGGGPVACNLARAGMRVLVLEAGVAADGPLHDVPAFHLHAVERPESAWRSFVHRHVTVGAVNYPRAAAVGGCSAYDALISMVPPPSTWDRIAELTADPSWQGSRMRAYFERLEACRYQRRPRGGAADPAAHGWEGWLSTYSSGDRLARSDGWLLAFLAMASRVVLAAGDRSHLRAAPSDPNDGRHTSLDEGLYQVPITTTRDGRRVSVRERIRETQWMRPDRLVVRTGCLATRIVLDEQRRAVGVEYVEGHRPDRGHATGPRRRVHARHEVILAAGALRTPHLLMLSGIGPAAELVRHAIPVRVPRSGVGGNLRDAYELSVVSRMRRPFRLFRGVSWRPPVAGAPLEPAYRDWLRGRGPYTSNGVALGIVRRSRPELPEPDLFLAGVPADFRGYHPGFAGDVARRRDAFTWLLVHAGGAHQAGRVALASADPLAPPLVDFHYFADDGGSQDLAALVAGVGFARRLNRAARVLVDEELVPGAAIDGADLERFVAERAWGKQACGTARIGRTDDPSAVVDSRFRVHGVFGLRVVDASVFPRVPSFFITTAIYMAAEKASEVILADVTGVAEHGGADAHLVTDEVRSHIAASAAR